MNIKAYGKMLIGDGNSTIIVQPKSSSSATRNDREEVLKLLMSGEYVLLQCIGPRNTINVKGDKECS